MNEVTQQLIVQGTSMATIPRGSVPLLDSADRSAVALAVNFLRSGCTKVQMIAGGNDLGSYVRPTLALAAEHSGLNETFSAEFTPEEDTDSQGIIVVTRTVQNE